MYPLKLYPVRLPEKHLEMIKDIARNRGQNVSVVMREMIATGLSAFSTIPSLKEVYRQVETHERELTEIKKALLKKGIIE